jgi:DNA-binding MarR family transcriptional regulator
MKRGKARPAAKRRTNPAVRERGRQIDQTALENLVGYNLRRAEVRMRQDFIRTLADWDIRPPEYSALTLIAANAFVTQADLVEALNVKRPNMVGLIDGLERRGLVERAVYEQDRRNQVLSITAKGEALLADIDQLVREMDRRITQCWTAKERAQVIELLQRFYRQ